MQGEFIQYIYLILVILALVMIAEKLRIAYPIMLVLGGLLLSLTARFSDITVDPELVFFIVILVTLVFQGLTLPWVIRKVKPEDKYVVIPEQRQEILIQKKLAMASLRFLEERYAEEQLQNEYLKNLHARLQLDLQVLGQELDERSPSTERPLEKFQAVYLELLDQQRTALYQMNRSEEFDEELIRKYLSLIDVEEFKIREKQLPEPIPSE